MFQIDQCIILPLLMPFTAQGSEYTEGEDSKSWGMCDSNLMLH